MAGQALVGVESRPQAVVIASGYYLDFREPRDAVLEKRGFIRSKVIQGTAGAWRATPHSWIDRPFCRASPGTNAGYDQGGECESGQNP
jgi:hypothetical protein